MTMSIEHAATLRGIQASLAGLSEQVARLLAELDPAAAVSASDDAGTADTAAEPASEAGTPDEADVVAEPLDAAAAGLSLDDVHGIGRFDAAIEAPAADDFTLIRGIDEKASTLLAELGLTRYADLVAFTADDVFEVARMLGDGKRVSREGWIEQAAVLATGAKTAFAVRAGVAVADASADEGEALDVGAFTPAATAVDSGAAEPTTITSADLAQALAGAIAAGAAAALLAEAASAASVVLAPAAPAAEIAAIETLAAPAAGIAVTSVEALPEVNSNVVKLPPLPARRTAKRTGKFAIAACVALLAVGTAAWRTLDSAGIPACKLLNACGTHVADVQE